MSLFCSRDMVHLKFLQPGYSRAFWPISRKSDFSQTWNLYREVANHINFYYRNNLRKINDKIFQ